MNRPMGISYLPATARLAALCVLVAVIVVPLSGAASAPAVATAAAERLTVATAVAASPPSGGAAIGATVTPRSATPASPAESPKTSQPTSLTLAKDLGQMIVARFAGTVPTNSILAAIKAGQVGGVILFSDNTAGGVLATHALVNQLQDAAVSGGNPRLVIMTDQEGGEVKRLPGPPDFAASQMGNPGVAAAQGQQTAQLLREAGINVDLAPVADVTDVDGFMTQEQRTFGSSPAVVAAAACAFAASLSAARVAYTLKHFPGLGDAIDSTDNGPVSVDASARLLYADEAAYRRCGANTRALVMISSASYPQLTASTPAVMSPVTYQVALKADSVSAVTISDDFQSPAIKDLHAPARTAINAGLDMVMYAQTESGAEGAYEVLDGDLLQGSLRASRVEAAAARIRALKQSLKLL